MMNHLDRAFSFQEIKSKDELIKAMFYCSWPLCYSFYHDKLLYLSDGESENSPEYAVVTIDKTEGRFCVLGRELGRIKPGSVSPSEAPELIRQINARRYASGDPVQFMAEPKWHHHCSLCGLDDEL